MRYNSGVLADTLKHKLDHLPNQPGVYFFSGKGGEALYVGKASNLRSRVRSYFQEGNSDQRAFIDRLATDLCDIETYVTATEKEATLLERGLIKERMPRYNVKLRDDKEYLSLRLDPNARYPRLEVVRKPKKDGARYFGPYHSASAARATLRVVNRHFQLRTCTDRELKSRTRVCLQYQIKRCLGPCVYEVDDKAYAEQIRNVGLFLDGRHDELISDLKHGMEEAATQLKYERAATYRDQIAAMQSTQEAQRVSLVTDIDQDVFGMFRKDDKAEVAVLVVRRGKVVGVRTFALRDVQVSDDEVLGSFLGEYYGEGSYVPHEMIVPLAFEAQTGLEEVLGEQAGHRVDILKPVRGTKAKLLRLAMDNAAHAYAEKAREQEDMDQRLARIQQRLGLPRIPERFECVDISHLGGRDTVAVFVAFSRGMPDKSRYRSFVVRTVSGGDDYGAMLEVLTRRLKRGKERQNGWELPNLLVVDGGKGQLAMAQRALQSLGIEDLPIAALAKEKERALGERVLDRIYMPGRKNPIELKSAGTTFSMFVQARDEAHRASNHLRTQVGKRRRMQSGLEKVQGVGPKTRANLLKALGSISAIKSASEEQLVEAGATRRQAQRIFERFHESTQDMQASEDVAIDNAFSDDNAASALP